MKKDKVIGLFDVLLAYVFLLVFAGSLVYGCFHARAFILSGVMLAAYFLWNIFRLRCPWCRSTMELHWLLRGFRHRLNCPNCGHEITVVAWVRKGPPKKLREQRNKEQ